MVGTQVYFSTLQARVHNREVLLYTIIYSTIIRIMYYYILYYYIMYYYKILYYVLLLQGIVTITHDLLPLKKQNSSTTVLSLDRPLQKRCFALETFCSVASVCLQWSCHHQALQITV